MFDIGWLELIVIAIVALVVVGPKDLPGLFKTVGNFMGRARGMAREFQRSMEQAADDSGLKDAASGLRKVSSFSPRSAKSYADQIVGDLDGMDKDKAAKPGKAGASPPKSAAVVADPAPDPAPAQAAAPADPAGPREP